MDYSVSIPANRLRRSSSRAAVNGHSHERMYRRDSNLSTSSFLDDVEMAHDEVEALKSLHT
jgi:cation-transporting P-type ATPase 13A2